MIEKEQQRIIDAQDKQNPGVRASARGSSLQEDMEAQRLRVALEEERQQHQYDLIELARLKKQKEDLVRKLKKTGTLGDEFHSIADEQDDAPESAPGCNVNGTQCVIA